MVVQKDVTRVSRVAREIQMTSKELWFFFSTSHTLVRANYLSKLESWLRRWHARWQAPLFTIVQLVEHVTMKRLSPRINMATVRVVLWRFVFMCLVVSCTFICVFIVWSIENYSLQRRLCEMQTDMGSGWRNAKNLRQLSRWKWVLSRVRRAKLVPEKKNTELNLRLHQHPTPRWKLWGQVTAWTSSPNTAVSVCWTSQARTLLCVFTEMCWVSA